jgi:hypothetical protein
VSVLWTAGLSAATRSAKNLAALVRDPNVEDTAGFERQTRILDEPRLLRWRRTLGVSRVHVLPDLFSERNTQAVLYYLLMLIPVLAAMLLALRWRGRFTSPSALPWPGLQIAVVTALALLLNLFLIRGNIDSRLGDVIVPMTFVGVAMLLSAVGLAAGFFPARRAAKADPLVALRHL